jgi:hypothetical protein
MISFTHTFLPYYHHYSPISPSSQIATDPLHPDF